MATGTESMITADLGQEMERKTVDEWNANNDVQWTERAGDIGCSKRKREMKRWTQRKGSYIVT